MGCSTLKQPVPSDRENTVTLTSKKPFSIAKPIQPQVDGVRPSGLKESFGGLIDGDNNRRPGSNAVAVLSRGGVILDIAPSARTARQTTEPVSTVVDALLERNALAGIRKAVQRRLDSVLSRESRG